jgi:hypothetical protein
MAGMIEHNCGHYEVHEVLGGKEYVWCPESTTLDCRCGERLILTRSDVVCPCGEDHSTSVQGKLAVEGLSDEALHPWRDEYRRLLEESRHPEYHHWSELSTVE